MQKIKKYWFIIIIIGLSVFRMFLAMNTNYAVIAGKFDDELAIHQGYSLLSGEWLGEYSDTTLIKGITYPCFVALVKALGLTYGQGLGILMIAASLIFIRMLYIFNKNKLFLASAYTFILYNPAGFGGWTALHIYRDVMTMWLLLILFSCVIAMYAYRKQEWKGSFAWIAGAVGSFVLLYFLREDGIWLYPFMILAFVICACSHYLFPLREVKKERAKRLGKTILFTLLPWICTGIVGLGIATLNYGYYGIFCVNDRTQGPFADMMSLIYQVEDDTTDENVWVTKEMLWKCIDASPTLSGMREDIEDGFYSRVQEDGQVHGDIIQWAMRVGFRNAGYYTDAAETQKILKQIVNELETAYQNGILQADDKIHLSAQGRGMTIEEIIYYIPAAVKHFFDLSAYDGCDSYYPYYPNADEELTEKFEIMLSTPLSEAYINQNFYVFTEKVYEIIRNLYQHMGKHVLKASCILFALLTLGELFVFRRKKEISRELEMVLPLAGIMLSGFFLIYIVTVFTSFLTIYNFYNYTTGIYTVFTIFEVFVAHHVFIVLRKYWMLKQNKVECKK